MNYCGAGGSLFSLLLKVSFYDRKLLNPPFPSLSFYCYFISERSGLLVPPYITGRPEIKDSQKDGTRRENAFIVLVSYSCLGKGSVY